MELLGDAYQDYSLGRMERASASLGRPFEDVLGRVTSSAIGMVEGIPAYSVKVESRHPGKTPSIGGFVHLFDTRSGELLAILESSFISGVGSALTGALATDLLASPAAKTLAVVGTGTQGWLGLRFLMEMRAIEKVNLFDLSRSKSKRTAERLKKYESLEVRVCDSLSEAVAAADIICCATWSHEPFLFPEMVKPGAHITTIGSDEEGKTELSAELLRGSSFFCDDSELAKLVGPLERLPFAQEMAVGELGEILAGQLEGRKSPDEITVYGAVGLPFVDLIAGWVTYRKALKKRSGRSIDPLA